MNTRIRTIRTDLGMSQTEFAENLGLTKNFISLLETGGRVPSERTINDICSKFRINEEWLRSGDGEMYAPQARNQQLLRFMNSVMDLPDDDPLKDLIDKIACMTTPELEKFKAALLLFKK